MICPLTYLLLLLLQRAQDHAGSRCVIDRMVVDLARSIAQQPLRSLPQRASSFS